MQPLAEVWAIGSARRWLVLSTASIATIGLVGALLASRYDIYDASWADGSAWSSAVARLHLDAERSVPSAFTAGLMLAVAYWSWHWWRSNRRHVALGFAALFVYLAADDWRATHEWLEWRTGVDWQLLYLPLGVAGAAMFAAIDRDLRSAAARWSWRGGAVAIGLALVLEQLQWSDGDVQVGGYAALMTAEEILEMVGPALFTLALIVATAGSVVGADARGFGAPDADTDPYTDRRIDATAGQSTRPIVSSPPSGNRRGTPGMRAQKGS